MVHGRMNHKRARARMASEKSYDARKRYAHYCTGNI